MLLIYSVRPNKICKLRVIKCVHDKLLLHFDFQDSNSYIFVQQSMIPDEALLIKSEFIKPLWFLFSHHIEFLKNHYFSNQIFFLMLKDKRIDELRRLLKRYKKIEEMVVQAQGRKGEYCLCVQNFSFIKRVENFNYLSLSVVLIL